MATDNQNIIEISPAAVEKIAALIADRERGSLAVRVLLHGRMPGGGYQSEFKLVELSDQTEDDLVQDTGAFLVFLSALTAESIRGAKVDFDTNRYSAGFHIEYPEQIADNPAAIARKDWTDPVALAVQDAIDHEINPGLAGHGGWVVLLDVNEPLAYIEMGGGCQGCGLSEATLKDGIEKIIRKWAPEIKQVLDVTDHAEGKNPYYTGAWQDGQSALDS